ncbi:hypothetical protein FBU30_007234 [Linnemannia zychae]|nr:hypothetical protein FBU30_007234 [Linnemannia zychae]
MDIAVDGYKLYRDILTNGSVPEREPTPLKSFMIFGQRIVNAMFAFEETLNVIIVEDKRRNATENGKQEDAARGEDLP